MGGQTSTAGHGKRARETPDKQKARKRVEDRLEEALEESFPASDPAQIVQPQRPEPGTAKQKAEAIEHLPSQPSEPSKNSG